MPKLEDAKKLAEWLVGELKPFCEIVEIGGSIRRGKPEVKDIEIIAIPKWEDAPAPPTDLFSGPGTVAVNILHDHIVERAMLGIRWIKPGTSVIEDWKPKPDGKYWRALLLMGGEEIKLDLFLARPENYGVIKMIRTGPADFNKALFAYLNGGGNFSVRDGQLFGFISPILCPTEEDFFRAIGIKFIPPAHRETWRDFKKLEGK
jgi:DNA polymerase/3'-5' exonuclease PolX